MNPQTEGLRKAARRVFWEAKQIDQAARAARTQVLEELLDRARSLREGCDKYEFRAIQSGYVDDDEERPYSAEWARFFAGERLGLATMAIAVRALLKGRCFLDELCDSDD